MTVSAVITLGLGQGVQFIPTLGYTPGGEAPTQAPTSSPAGGWLMRPRYEVRTDRESREFESLEEAGEYLAKRKKNTVQKIGKVYVQDVPINDFRPDGLEIIRSGDAERLRELQRTIEIRLAYLLKMQRRKQMNKRLALLLLAD